ncbi:unnamed protein product, partial [Owenia fusiformis]
MKQGEVLNYDRKNMYKIILRSTDNGTPEKYVEKDIFIKINEVNNPPTNIVLRPSEILENSGLDETVGILRGADSNRELTKDMIYELIDDANGLFKIKGNVVKVARSNETCITTGRHCWLDFEQKRKVDITVRVSDQGRPPLSFTKKLQIKINDINDPPVNIKLGDNTIDSFSKQGDVIGQISLQDDDIHQRHTFESFGGDTNEFAVFPNGTVYKNSDAILSMTQQYRLLVKVTDSGNSPASNVASVSITVTNKSSGITIGYFPRKLDI